MAEAIVYVIGVFFALALAVRFIIDAQTKLTLRMQERSQQLNTTNDLSLRLASLETTLNVTLRSIHDDLQRTQHTLDSRAATQELVAQVRDEMREFRSQAASQQTLEHIAKYLVEMRQELSTLQEVAMLTKVNTGRIASIERHILAIHTIVVSPEPNQNMMQFPPGMLPPGMGPGMWKPLGIKREDGKYKTEDGEHEADSLEELLSKLAHDPQYRVDPNFRRINPTDIEEMKNMFEGELDDDDEEDEKWRDQDGTE